jgi:polysaccharide export outer membrane protein
VLERLRLAEPDGRVVLDLPPEAVSLPDDLVMENNDRLLIPPRPSTVGVFGAVYRPASFLLGSGEPKRVRDYLDRAGGIQAAGDKRNVFVVRASGEVVARRGGAMKARVLPGDVIFVPVKTDATSVWTKLREISSIVFQFGLGAAAFVAVAK